MPLLTDIERERYEAIVESLKQEQAMIASTFEAMTGFDYATVFKEYALRLAIHMDELTDQQKQQAIMDAILKEQ